jgi:hypothetical protein
VGLTSETVTIGGRTIAITGEKNQTIQLGLLTIIVNEQHASSDETWAKAEVMALHVEIRGLLYVVVSDAAADISCTCGPRDRS